MSATFAGGELLYSTVNTETTLAARDDRPIWPVRHEADLDVLRTIARSFGGIVSHYENGTPQLLSGSSPVFAFGKDVAREAALYAHLTLRKYVAAHSVKDFQQMPPDAVVITTEERVTEKLLRVLFEAGSQRNSVGLIYAPTLSQLREQVLQRSAAAYLCRSEIEPPPPNTQRIDLFSTEDLGSVTTPQWQLLGNQSTAAEVKAALSGNAGVISLISHSDGIDAPLSNEVVLCAIDGAVAVGAPDSDAPACVVSGVCHRRGQPIDVALSSGTLIFPNIIRARIVLADLCWGLLPPLEVIHPAWGLGRRLLENHSIGAFITSWEIMRSSLPLITPLVDAVANGKPVGDSLAEQLASDQWIKFGRRMCLIGDPRVRLPKPLEPVRLPVGLQSSQRRGTRAGAVEFLRAYICVARKNIDGTYDDRSGEALEAMGAYQEALWTGELLEGTPDAPGPRLRDSFLTFALGRFGVAYPIWQQFADDWVLLEARSCYACGRTADTAMFYLGIPGASARRVTNCQSCGTVEDVPIGTNLTFSVALDGELKLRGELPVGDLISGVMLETSLPAERRSFRWPTDAHGKLAQTFLVPGPWPVGPIRVSIFIISEDCEFISLGRQCRGERIVHSANPQ